MELTGAKCPHCSNTAQSKIGYTHREKRPQGEPGTFVCYFCGCRWTEKKVYKKGWRKKKRRKKK